MSKLAEFVPISTSDKTSKLGEFVRIPTSFRIKIPRKLPKHVGAVSLDLFAVLGAGAEYVGSDEREFTLLASGHGDFFEPKSVTHCCAFSYMGDDVFELHRSLGVALVQWWPRLNTGEDGTAVVDVSRLKMARDTLEKYREDRVETTYPKVTSDIVLQFRSSYDKEPPLVILKLLRYCTNDQGGRIRYEQDATGEKWNLVIG